MKRIRAVCYNYMILLTVIGISLCGAQYFSKRIFLNSPYKKAAREANHYYTTFSERPKTLDPARAYANNEFLILSQVVEPPLQYHYLKRPHQLIPLALQKMPEVTYLDQNGRATQAEHARYTRYRLSIKPNRFYSPHPAFARDPFGVFYYHSIGSRQIPRSLNAFRHQGHRAVRAEDFVYQIKRLADPNNHSPILSVMKRYIVGFDRFAARLKKVRQTKTDWLDLRQYACEGLKILSDNRYDIILKGRYPQFIFWLSMPFLRQRLGK